jgi:hypothetical protein
LSEPARERLPVEAFLEAYPPGIVAIAQELRRLVREAAPDVVERVRGGWALVGYDVPVGRGKVRYTAFVAPETEHCHLGFEVGTLMRPHPALEGAHLGLRKVRFLTWRPGEAVDVDLVRELVAEATGIARMSAGERALLRETRAADYSSGAPTAGTPKR